MFVFKKSPSENAEAALARRLRARPPKRPGDIKINSKALLKPLLLIDLEQQHRAAFNLHVILLRAQYGALRGGLCWFKLQI